MVRTSMKNMKIVTLAMIVLLFIIIGVWKKTSLLTSENGAVKTGGEPDRSSEIAFRNYYNMATEFLNKGYHDSASVYYEKALQVNPGHEGALYNQGNSKLFIKDFKGAETSWLRLSELNPYSARARIQLGTLYFCLDQKNELFDLPSAETQFLQAHKMNREETGPPLYLAKIAILNNRPAIAGEYTENILASNFMSYQALFLKGYLEWKKKMHEKSREKFSRADSLFHNTLQVEMAGEGATGTGFRPMLSEDMFCDFFGNRIQELLADQRDFGYEWNFEQFDRSVHTWKSLAESEQEANR